MSIRHERRQALDERRREYKRTHRPHERYVMKGAITLGLAALMALWLTGQRTTVVQVGALAGFCAGGLIAYVIFRLDRHHTVSLLRQGRFRQALWRRRYRIVRERGPFGGRILMYETSVGEDYPFSNHGRVEFYLLIAVIVVGALLVALIR